MIWLSLLTLLFSIMKDQLQYIFLDIYLLATDSNEGAATISAGHVAKLFVPN